MFPGRFGLVGLLGMVLFPIPGWGSDPAKLNSGAQLLTFEKDIRPIFKAYCLDCHGAEASPKGKLDLRLSRFALKGGKNGPALVAGQPRESLLLERVVSGDMPPGEKKVPAEQIALIEKWIAQGARTIRPEPESIPPGLGITEEERSFWFYQPLKAPRIPSPEKGDRSRTPIDALILAKLKEKGLAFQPDADPATLIRRATYDLTGLAPTQAEIDAFLADRSANAYETLLDRLLASPAYGERWARFWLDTVGYADSDGDGANDTTRPHAWRYRDYVIRSFNEDKPWDRFITEQLAGDELIPRPWNQLTPGQVELLAATGFLRTAPDGTSSQNTPKQAEIVMADTIKILSSALIGSSVGCAQCHDHRYDPIPQQDYFQIRAILEPTLDPGQWRVPGQRLQSLFTEENRKKSAAIDAEVARMQAELSAKQTAAVKAIFAKEVEKFPEPARTALKAAFETPADKRTAEQKQLVDKNPKLNITPGVIYQFDTKLDEEIKALSAAIQAKSREKPIEPFVAIATEAPGRVPATRLHHRGDPRQPVGNPLAPADLTIAYPEGKRPEIPAKDPGLPSSGRRLAWARQLTSGHHPLFNRVQVNRIWLRHFGKGLVDTPGEFGRLGQLPSHPELLDHLALEWPKLGWSLKRLHKAIMTSTVYRQQSLVQQADPSNLLYSRYPIQRLDAEAVRDRMLQVAGRLDRTPFGPPVETAEDATGQPIAPDDKPRRSIYLQMRRSKPIGFLTVFDLPVGELQCDRRVVATTPQQSLALMNSDFVRVQAGHIAARVVKETPMELALPGPSRPEWDRPASVWSFGYGRYDPNGGQVQFQKLPHFQGSQWQGGNALPDAKLGWVLLHAQGGHCGNDADHAAIRRWTAPQDGLVSVSGTLSHGSPHGDGVRARMVQSGKPALGEWEAKNANHNTPLTGIRVKQGQTIDFIVDCKGDVSCDSFSWPVRIELVVGAEKLSWDSTKEFHGPAGASLAQRVVMAWRLILLRQPTLDEIDLACRFVLGQMSGRGGSKSIDEQAALTHLCQQLLASNEYLYVD